jgi:hypothetical protein
VNADLGGGLIKLRVARQGQGKRGGYRLLIAFRSKLRAVFQFGFAKSDLDNIDDDQLATLLVLCFAGQIAAGPFEDADAAYRRGDYATALRLFLKVTTFIPRTGMPA